MTTENARPAEPSLLELFTPKLVAILPGITASAISKRMCGRLIMAIIALPLSMAIAIASGVTPDGGSTPPLSGASVFPRLAAAASRSADRLAPSSCLSRPQCSSTGLMGFSSRRSSPG
jgi:hypothetical protein